MKTYFEGRFEFAKIEENVMDQLRNIEPEDMFVKAETVKNIEKILNLGNIEPKFLRPIRNTIVKDLGDDWDMHTRISMITAVIDNHLWRTGQPV